VWPTHPDGAHEKTDEEPRETCALQPIQFYCLRAGEYVHAARDHAADLEAEQAADDRHAGARLAEQNSPDSLSKLKRRQHSLGQLERMATKYPWLDADMDALKSANVYTQNRIDRMVASLDRTSQRAKKQQRSKTLPIGQQ
jgi:hypothetical protein